MSWHINDEKVAVSDRHCWLPINGMTPKGVKCLLLTPGGVCIISIWDGKGDYEWWAPLPRKMKVMDRLWQLRDHEQRMRINEEFRED